MPATEASAAPGSPKALTKAQPRKPLPTGEADRRFHRPLGRRPDDHPGLTALGF